MQDETSVVIFVEGRDNQLCFVHVSCRYHHPYKYESAYVRHLSWKKFAFPLGHLEYTAGLTAKT